MNAVHAPDSNQSGERRSAAARSCKPGWLIFAAACAVLAPVCYIGADLSAALSYEGYSLRDQAVSELFAIGAPTSLLVTHLFTLSSLLLAGFAAALLRSADDRRVLRTVAWLMLLNAIDSLILWNFFPMHMRGVQPTVTDTMHGVFAINPFPLLTMIVAAVNLSGWFRSYTLATIAVVAATAATAFIFVPAFLSGGPTAWMGLAERTGQYVHQIWHAVFGLVLLRGSISRSSETQSATVAH